MVDLMKMGIAQLPRQSLPAILPGSYRGGLLQGGDTALAMRVSPHVQHSEEEQAKCHSMPDVVSRPCATEERIFAGSNASA